ncbi:SMI1/KNR4 family protein [Actinosynnema sp. NPDC050436]|uniref:SMI1/KNR4 family protein n=1 Tax=Actinosynnema sp. NPDC050436 TaxID=3155659 RepID=UPI0033DBB735
MRPDLVLLRELVEHGTAVTAVAGRGASAGEIGAAEAVVGPLSPSFRWWLAEYGSGALDGEPIASLRPDGFAEAPAGLADRLDGARLWFYEEHCGDRYGFALDDVVDGEHAVVRRDAATGDDEPCARSFAGFLAVREALAAGLRDGPNPTVARLWNSTPGVLREDGVLIYGPQAIRERNETFGVREHAPDWVLVGDDSGGSGFFMRRHGRDRESVHLLGLGALDRDVAAVGEHVTDDLLGWLVRAPHERSG